MERNNIVVLVGRIASEPVARQLRSGTWVVNFDVTTELAAGAASVPVVFNATTVDAGPGDEVVIAGHVRRRFFRVGGATQSRTEVVAGQLVRAARVKTAERLLAQVVAVLDGC